MSAIQNERGAHYLVTLPRGIGGQLPLNGKAQFGFKTISSRNGGTVSI